MTGYRVLQIVSIKKAKSGEKDIRKAVKLDINVSDLDEFKENMLKLLGADEVKLTYEEVDDEYEEME